MKIKRFFAPDMRRALAQVRSEHGAEAVILSTTSVEGGVEVVSALDYDSRLMTENTPRDAKPQESAPAASMPPAPAVNIWTQDPVLRAMQGELESMKQMLQEQFAHLAWADLKTFQPERALLRRRVAALGLDDGWIDVLVDEAFMPGDPINSWREVVRGMSRRIRLLEEDPLEQGGVIALVGPTGVGKTTTIAKLAARHCLRHGPDSIALISTDNYRVGAQRQLEAFGSILGVPVRRADTDDALGRLLREQQSRRLILIDTAGLAPRDGRVAGAVQAFLGHSQIRRYLVLPANMQAAAMSDSFDSFGAGGLAGVVLTKTDEASGLGGAVSVLMHQQVPIAWVGNGQRVPEDLKVARLHDLAGWAAKPPNTTVAKTRSARTERTAPVEETLNAAV